MEESLESESGGEELADLEEEGATDGEELQEGMSDMRHNLLCIKRGHPVSSTPFSKSRDLPASRALKRRRLITAANVHSCLVSPLPVSISLPSFSPDSPDPVSPSLASSRPASEFVFNRSVSPDRSVASLLPDSVVRGRGHGVRGTRRRRGTSQRGRGQGDPDSSATSLAVQDSSTTSTATGSKKKKGSAPIRFPSKETPTVIAYWSRHPFTEDVGPTKPLPATAKALDFFLQMFDHDLMGHIVEQTYLYARTREGHHADWEDLTVLELKAFLGTKILMGLLHCPP